MRSLKVFAALLILLFLNAAVCFAVGEETTDDYSSFYESSGADRLGDTLPDDIKDSLDSAGIDIADWQSLLSPLPKKLVSMLGDMARGSFLKPIKDMALIAGIVILVGLIKGTAAAENFSEPLNTVIGCAVAITVFASSAGVISQGVSAVKATSDFMLALIPVLAGIITAAGNPTLALTYGSFAMAAAQTAAQTAGNVIMPLCGAFSAFGVSASLSPELKLAKLTEMIKKLAIGVLSFAAAAFSTVLGLKSLLAGSADTLTSKGIKLALSSAVPIVGGALSDAYSSIIGSVALLKSTVGVFGVIAVVLMDLPVILQLTARILLLKLLGVLSSSMGDDASGEVLETLSSALTVINAAIIFTAALFIISTGIVISVKAGA